MNFFIGILACLMIACGVLTALLSISAIHQILAAVLFGFGLVALSMVVLIRRVEDLAVRNQQSQVQRADLHPGRRRAAAPSGHSLE